MLRRGFIRSLGLGVAALALGRALPAHALGDETYARFIAARAANPWLAGWETLESDLPRQRLRIEGRLPRALRGTLFRNGPGRFERDGFRYRHWFDGDGLVQAWRLDDAGVTHAARFVRTEKYKAESEAGRFLYHGAGTTVPDPRPGRNGDDFNAANTAMIAHAGRLQALWEGGSAWNIDPDTLETLGVHTFRSDLAALPYSAHPLPDTDGSLWNFGMMAYLDAPTLLVWHVGADGALRSCTPLETGFAGYLHSFAQTERHLVFVLSPLLYERDGNGAFFELLRWRPERHSLALIVDKNDPTRVIRHELPAGLVYHWADAQERDGAIHLGGCWYDDAEPVQRDVQRIMRGEPMQDAKGAELVTLRLPLGRGNATLARSGIGAVEFPEFAGRSPGPRRHLYALAQRGTAIAYVDSVLAIDRKRERTATWRYGDGVLAEEHRFVPRPGGRDENDGWLVGTALDSNRGEHLLAVFDARDVAAGPICQARLPRMLPLSFHADFLAA